MIDLDVPGTGLQKMKVEARTVLAPDGTQALHRMILEDITAVVRSVSEKGEAFSGDAHQGEQDR